MSFLHVDIYLCLPPKHTSGSQWHPPEALQGQGVTLPVGKATGLVQQAIILLWFTLSAGLFWVPRHLFVPVLESPASELRDQTDTGAAAMLVGSGGGGPSGRAWRWPRTPTQQDTALFLP